MSKCVKCGKEYDNDTYDMCHGCFINLKHNRKESDKKKRDIRKRRRQMRRVNL